MAIFALHNLKLLPVASFSYFIRTFASFQNFHKIKQNSAHELGGVAAVYKKEEIFMSYFIFVELKLLFCVLCSSSSSSSSSSMAAKATSSVLITAAAAATPTDMSTAILMRVDQSGKGDFRKIQDAIDSVPSNSSELYFIWVKPGTYREKIVVPGDKPFLTISGTTASTTIITWTQSGGIFESPTMSILASDFVGRYLTIQNTFGSKGKAVALRVSADKAAFYGCRIMSYQDTLLDDLGKHYYSNCYIEGATDFICGDAASLFEKCHLHSIHEETGIISAQSRKNESENTGFTFLGCKITGAGTVILGRPWGAYSRVVFAYTHMPNVISPQGWDDWNDPSKHSTVFYGEYKCYGPGANRSKRVAWSRSLSSTQAAPYMTKDMIGGRGWLRPAPTHFKTGSTTITMKADEIS